ncbi:hypothetical protein BC831DRAFT_184495 [Entophlyctis helioformis]|nr:hypothetical protein BC831DRAFT_184495 [Entophlyctis helioformis]
MTRRVATCRVPSSIRGCRWLMAGGWLHTQPALVRARSRLAKCCIVTRGGLKVEGWMHKARLRWLLLGVCDADWLAGWQTRRLADAATLNTRGSTDSNVDADAGVVDDAVSCSGSLWRAVCRCYWWPLTTSVQSERAANGRSRSDVASRPTWHTVSLSLGTQGSEAG